MTKGLGDPAAKQYVGGHHNSMMNPIMEKDDYFDTADDFAKSSEFGNMGQSKISNHYEVPNMSSMLYEFTNKE